MAVNVGNPSSHRPQRSFRDGAALSTDHTYPQIISVTHSARKWPHLVQSNSTRTFLSKSEGSLLGLKNSSSPKLSTFIVAVQAKINGSTSPEDTDNVSLVKNAEAIEDSPLTIGKNLVRPVRDISIPLHQLRQGEFLENRMVYRQKYVIRSYDVGADKTTPITTIFNLFQEASLCHFDLMGIAARDGFGATKVMHRLGLISVMAKIHAEVVDFPKWPDVIESDSLIAPAGKNGARYEWILRRYETNEVLVRATSTWCAMNSTTRRLCKAPVATRAEVEPFFSEDRFVEPEKKRFRDMLSTHGKAFALSPEEIGCVHPKVVAPMVIFTVSHVPWDLKPILVTRALLPKLVSLLKEKMQMGILEPSMAPHSNRWFTVPKKSGALKFIQNMQPANKITIRN